MTISARSLLVLASASPARRQLLYGSGFAPVICPSELDESQVRLTHPMALVETLAQLKAEHVAKRVRQEPDVVGACGAGAVLVLGCDSVLSLAGQIYGKPASPEEAIARWQAMRGTSGELYTGHALIDVARNVTLVNCEMTRVHFASIDDATIAAYVATGEPLGCAGCFAIDGRGGLFVEKIEGCHTNVIGLSLPLLRRMMNELGYTPQDFWTAA